MNDELMELPKGWITTKLGECLRLINGRAYLRHELLDQGTPIIRIQNLNGGDKWFYSDLQLDRDKYCDKGDLLFAWSATFGPFIWQGSRSIYHYHIWKIEPFEVIDQKFAYYLLEKITQAVKAAAHGVAMPHMTKQGMENWQIQIPPLNEQKRIVAKIEELRERSQKARSHLSAIPNLCNKFRQSVLAAAFRGDLTADWREQNPDVEPASVLLERVRLEHRKRWEIAELERMKARGKEPRNDKWKEKYLELEDPAISTSTDFPEGWAWTTIGHVAECLDSKRIPINKEEREKRQGDIPYYGANGQVGWIDDFIFDDPLVILVEDETFIGRTKPFCYKITGKSWVNNHAHVLRATEALDIDYLNYSLMFYPFIPLTSGTTGRRKLTQGALMSAPYALPPLDEQRQIVAAIEQYFETIERTQQVLNSDFNLIAQLDRSILAKAFRGELVEQEPNDEPASILLERIRAEREQQAQGKAKKPGKKGQRTIKTDPP